MDVYVGVLDFDLSTQSSHIILRRGLTAENTENMLLRDCFDLLSNFN